MRVQSCLAARTLLDWMSIGILKHCHDHSPALHHALPSPSLFCVYVLPGMPHGSCGWLRVSALFLLACRYSCCLMTTRLCANRTRSSSATFAVAFAGLSRSLKHTLPSFRKNVFQVLSSANIEYDVFWSTNLVSEEGGASVDEFDFCLMQPCKLQLLDQLSIKDALLTQLCARRRNLGSIGRLNRTAFYGMKYIPFTNRSTLSQAKMMRVKREFTDFSMWERNVFEVQQARANINWEDYKRRQAAWHMTHSNGSSSAADISSDVPLLYHYQGVNFGAYFPDCPFGEYPPNSRDNWLVPGESLRTVGAMIRAFAADRNVTYDAVVFLRPDTAVVDELRLPAHLALIKKHPSLLFLPPLTPAPNDRLAYGSPQAMFIYLNRGQEHGLYPIAEMAEEFLGTFLPVHNISYSLGAPRVVRVRTTGEIAKYDIFWLRKDRYRKHCAHRKGASWFFTVVGCGLQKWAPLTSDLAHPHHVLRPLPHCVVGQL